MRAWTTSAHAISSPSPEVNKERKEARRRLRASFEAQGDDELVEAERAASELSRAWKRSRRCFIFGIE